MAWVESDSPSFRARHSAGDAEDAAAVLRLLERTRAKLELIFPRGAPGGLTVVLHEHPAALALAQPTLILAWALTHPAGRRYLVGWPGSSELHALAPRVLRRRASSVAGSRELLDLAPAALYVRTVIAASNPTLPPPHTPRRLRRYLERAWIVEGTAQWFADQTAHARPAIARRLREGPRPTFPPGLRDASLLGGTLIDLLVREEGVGAAIQLACGRAGLDDEHALQRAFGGRPRDWTEAAWRGHLERLTSGTVQRQPLDTRGLSEPTD
ncbi:MAG: hypothetical protein DLM63_01920 [Solirubrobacterales bacterium]|nr:MAG: hypothetical protein DLM63_01920 [Solirubrobacterales bacterium]